MSTTVQTSAAPSPGAAPGPADAGGSRRATLALARAEARRLLLHPLVVGAVALYLALLLWPENGTVGATHPVLQNVDRETQLGGVLIGVAVLVAANMAVLRPRRHGTDECFGVLVLPPSRRTAAHLLSLLPVAAVAAVLVVAWTVFEASKETAVGRANLLELATGPVIVLLFGAFGVLLGRLFRSAFVAPLVVVLMVVAFFVAGVAVMSYDGLLWLMPAAYEEGASPLPTGLIGRPAAWHLLYVAGLAVLAGALAVWRAGGARLPVKLTAAGALGAVVLGAVVQSAAPTDEVTEARRKATQRPAAMQECERRGPTTYCAFPEFAPWTDEWDATVRGVRGLVPGEVARRELTFRQHVNALAGVPGIANGTVPPAPVASWAADDRRAGTPGAVPFDTAWDSSSSALSLAALAAHTLVTGAPPVHGDHGFLCGGRALATGWLTVMATPRTEAAMEEHVDGPSSPGWLGAGLSGFGAGVVVIPERDAQTLQRVLERPRAEVARRVAASWKELTSPGTPIERAAELLGVTAPPGTEEDAAACG